MLSSLFTHRSVRNLLSCSVLALSVSAMGCDDSTGPGDRGRSVYAVDEDNRLIRFGAETPGNVTRNVAITGLQPSEAIVGIDFRTAASPNDRLFAVGSSNRVYTIDTLTGVATVVSAGAFTPVLAGTVFDIDFNPVVDLIRVHGFLGQNLRLSPTTGFVANTDATLTYAVGDAGFGQVPALAGTAYTNSVVGASTTMLFGIDATRDVLVTLAAPNTGSMTTVGALNVNTNSSVGFDIVGTGPGVGYATLTTDASGSSTFYRVNLTTGATTRVGRVAHSAELVGMAVVQ